MLEFLEYRVLDAMSADPTTIAPDRPLADAEAIFDRHDFNALPVVDAEGRLLGVLTKLDLLAAFREIDGRMFTPYDQIMQKPVEAYMTKVPKVATVTARTPMPKALERLIETGSKSLPVVDDERVVGMVSREDVLRALRRAVVDRETPREPI